MSFANLRLAEPILRAVTAEGYTKPTPIQEQAIPLVRDGRDVLGCAQTGTGKTAAFALPILHRLAAPAPAPAPAPGSLALGNPVQPSHAAQPVHAGHNGQPGRPSQHGHGTHSRQPGHAPAQARSRARCLVLCPTRELAVQIGESFRVYGRYLGMRQVVIYGGVGQGPQVEALRRGVDIAVATPGRLLDLMQQGHVDLRGIEVLVLDEADRMLDMGFIDDIRRIVAKVPAERQTLFFSATMPAPIRRLADTILRNPATVQVAPPAATADGIAQSVYFVDRANKSRLLAHLVETLPMYRTLVFTRTKHGADRVVRHLHQNGIGAEAIHSNKSQGARQRALDGFRNNKTQVLVATDIASRGIDVDGITHVVNYDLSHEPETYVHRIGRTARAGAQGAAVSFCDREEVGLLKAIERLIRRPIPVKAHSLPSLPPAAASPPRPSEHAAHPFHATHAPRHAAHPSSTPAPRAIVGDARAHHPAAHPAGPHRQGQSGHGARGHHAQHPHGGRPRRSRGGHRAF